jgi:hypothetical protein
MKRRGHLYFSAFLLLVSGFAIFSGSQWSFKTGFFPLAVAIPLLILTLIHVYLESFGAPEISKGPAVEADFSGEVSPEVARRRAITIFSWIAGFILFVCLIGFPWTVPLFIFSYLKISKSGELAPIVCPHRGDMVRILPTFFNVSYTFNSRPA